MDTTVSYTNGTYAAALDAANCAISGAEAITQGQSVAFALCRPPGHHAGREICGGYCYLNNAAIAAQWLSRLGRVVILDVDFHAGNGTQEIFYDRPDVYMISIHADPGGEYPYFAGHAWEKGIGPGLGYHQNFPLSPGTDDGQYLEVLDQALVLIDRFSLQHLVVSAGMDTYKDDPLGSLSLPKRVFGRLESGLQP